MRSPEGPQGYVRIREGSRGGPCEGVCRDHFEEKPGLYHTCTD